ncbi:MAG: sigma-70 family RNA polymerase sigma factor [Phycisphaerales bacterium]
MILHPAAHLDCMQDSCVEPADDAWSERTTLALRAGGASAHAALEALHAARRGFVAEIAVAALRTRADLAPDAAQEAWLRVVRRPAHCRSRAELDAWLRRVVVSAALDLLRRELRQRTRIERAAAAEIAGNHAETSATARAASSAHTLADDAETLARLRAQLDGLASQERLLLDLRFRAGMSIAQAAAALGIGPAAAGSRLRRALAQLRQAGTERTP